MVSVTKLTCIYSPWQLHPIPDTGKPPRLPPDMTRQKRGHSPLPATMRPPEHAAADIPGSEHALYMTLLLCAMLTRMTNTSTHSHAPVRSQRLTGSTTAQVSSVLLNGE